MEISSSAGGGRAAAQLRKALEACELCPRTCGAARAQGGRGFCRAGALASVNLAQLHFGEEPPISGQAGSGTVFFAGCTLACCFCQNWPVSQEGRGRETDARELSGIFLDLAAQGAHNLNLVTPTPHLAVIAEALGDARENGLELPVVYNSSGYERPETLRLLEGLIDIYLPDFKYADDRAAFKLSGVHDYVRNATAAIQEMYRQVGNLRLDENGLARRGLLVRHLVLPENLAGTEQVMAKLLDIAGPGVWVSMMSQYTPLYKARNHPQLGRAITGAEYDRAREALEKAGVENGFVQDPASADDEYIPDFI